MRSRYSSAADSALFLVLATATCCTNGQSVVVGEESAMFGDASFVNEPSVELAAPADASAQGEALAPLAVESDVPALPAGEAEVTLVHKQPGSESGTKVQLRSEETTLIFDASCPARWGLWIPLVSPTLAHRFALFLWFLDTKPASGQIFGGDLTTVSVDIPDIEHGGAVFDDLGALGITESTLTTVTGKWLGNVNVQVAFYAPNAQPTGESFQIRDVRFNQVTRDQPPEQLRLALESCVPLTVLPPTPSTMVPDDPSEACSLGWPSEARAPDVPGAGKCQAIYEDLCFEDSRIACRCADCECIVLESLPAMVSCPN